jgi:hypothetical protein
VRLALFILLLGCSENLTPPGLTPYAPGTEPPLACAPNLDGVLEAGELPIAFGAEARFLVNPQGEPRAFDLAGTVDEDTGGRTWDLSPDYASDRVVPLEVAPIAEQWFAASFPLADYVAPIDLEGTVLGAYHLDERGVWLHGVASREENPPDGRTLLPYDAPVPVVRFPVTPGDRWIETGEVSEGEAFGLAYRGTDTYEVRVTGAGRLDLPDWSFGQAWQIDQRVTVAPAIGVAVERRIVTWLFECFGEVARAESANDMTDPFTEAAELRRLTLR